MCRKYRKYHLLEGSMFPGNGGRRYEPIKAGAGLHGLNLRLQKRRSGG